MEIKNILTENPIGILTLKDIEKKLQHQYRIDRMVKGQISSQALITWITWITFCISWMEMLLKGNEILFTTALLKRQQLSIHQSLYS